MTMAGDIVLIPKCPACSSPHASCFLCGRSWCPACAHRCDAAPAQARTQCPGDFSLAIAAVDDVLAEYHTNKGDSWREKSPRHHAGHALEHAQTADAILWSPGAGDVREHLTHLATRALMALEQHLAAAGGEHV